MPPPPAPTLKPTASTAPSAPTPTTSRTSLVSLQRSCSQVFNSLWRLRRSVLDGLWLDICTWAGIAPVPRVGRDGIGGFGSTLRSWDCWGWRLIAVSTWCWIRQFRRDILCWGWVLKLGGIYGMKFDGTWERWCSIRWCSRNSNSFALYSILHLTSSNCVQFYFFLQSKYRVSISWPAARSTIPLSHSPFIPIESTIYFHFQQKTSALLKMSIPEHVIFPAPE